jgi:uncharacterized protein YndB with AHSA1/START domain
MVLEVSRILAAPADRAWEVLTDTARWTAWGPSIREVTSTDRIVRAGTRGRVRLAIGPWLRFEVTRFDPGRAWSWRVHGIRATGHRVEALGPARCRVVFEVPWVAWPYALVCRRALRRIARLVGDAGRAQYPEGFSGARA